jgi:hypothetical protein
MEYLIFILIGWGITDFLVSGSILDRVRVYALVKIPLLGKLLSCVRCSGFWVGVLMWMTLSLIEFFPLPLTQPENFKVLLAQIFASGFLISGSSVIINSLLFYFHTAGMKTSIQKEEPQETDNLESQNEKD